MDVEDCILDELNITSPLHENILNRLHSRKEEIYLSAYVFVRKKSKVNEKRIVITNQSIYFLRKALGFCCGSSGLSFASRKPVNDIVDVTIDHERKCIVVHFINEDDIFIQLTQKLDGEEEAIHRLTESLSPRSFGSLSPKSLQSPTQFSADSKKPPILKKPLKLKLNLCDDPPHSTKRGVIAEEMVDIDKIANHTQNAVMTEEQPCLSTNADEDIKKSLQLKLEEK